METNKIPSDHKIELPLNELTRELHLPNQFNESTIQEAVYSQIVNNLLLINQELTRILVRCQNNAKTNFLGIGQENHSVSTTQYQDETVKEDHKINNNKEGESIKSDKNTLKEDSNIKSKDSSTEFQIVDNRRKNTPEWDSFIEEVRFKAKSTKRNRVTYRCTYEGCSKKCQKRWNLIDHIKVHLGIMPYQCEICGVKFVQKGNLKKHIRMHDVPDLNQRKVYKCTLCTKSYTERYNLTHHMVSEHGVQDTYITKE